jgi:hypothetical protein
MRLIDADKLVKAIENENHGLSISGAEEKFAKIIQVNMQPTVKAIPIEWIEKQIEKALSVDSVDMFYVGNLKYLIKDWEKENDR